MQSKKKKLGQFFTEPTIAKFMVKLVLKNDSHDVLDPAVGMGAFTEILSKENPDLDITACEIDPEMIINFKKEKHYSCTLFEQDYLSCTFDKKFDAIICNPPYNKFQAIPNRCSMIEDFYSRYNIKMSGYSNLCVYFLVKSMNELNENGKCCYIIPYEFMNTGYGKGIKQYLLDSKMLKTIIKFNNTLSLFSEAVTTSCILLLENKEHSHIDFIDIDNIDELDHIQYKNKKKYSYSDLSSSEKWLQYFEFQKDDRKYSNIVKLSVFGRVSRGIATGNNSFFALNKSMIEAYHLSTDVCFPCLTKAPDVKDIIFTKESFDRLLNADKKVYLFNGQKASTDEDKTYIQLGEAKGVHKAYLTSHRSPWYALEYREAAPILICVFSRKKIKVIRNELGIRNLTAFHGLYLKNDSPDFVNMLFCYMLTPLAQELLYHSRREYGDGLTKFEPNDLTKAVMLDLRIITDKDKEEILKIYDEIKKANSEVKIYELDSIFRKYVNSDEISFVQYTEPVQLSFFATI